MVRQTSPIDAFFGTAARGVRWALSEVPGAEVSADGCRVGRRELIFKRPARARGDGYEIHHSSGRIAVVAGTAVGAVNALLDLAGQVRRGRPEPVARTFPFRTRFYKHEIRFEGPQRRRRRERVCTLTHYTGRFVEHFCREIVRRKFNALVLYAGYHPFAHFLDYRGFEHAAEGSAAVRRRNLQALRRLLAAARAYGLRTFLHHYVSHFTQALADHLKLGFREGGMRLAAFEHPAVAAYNRYVYRRTFQLLPELDGLFVNFESIGDAADFLERTLLPEAARRRRRPALFFRLWGVSDVEAMTRLLKKYDGPKGVIHKGHETNDLYYYPVCDARIRIWKSAMPEVEFTYSLGPCHNCGTNISRKLWTDPDYIHALLDDMQAKGADSISFQSSSELLLHLLPDAEVFPPAARSHSRMNLGHLEAVVDYIEGRRPSRRQWARRYARWFDTTPAAGEAVRRATVESSQIILKMYRQFAYGSPQEGYIYPGRFSHYQEPFFYYPMSFFNRLGEIPHNVGWLAWAVRRRPVKVVPNDTQAIIDYVNPAIRRRPANHPGAIIRQIKAHIARSVRAVETYRRLAGKNADEAFIAQVQRNVNNGERIWREIRIAIELYSCYFAASRRGFWRHLRRARDLMLESVTVLGDALGDTDAYCSTTASGPYQPDVDAAQLSTILEHQREEFPFEALRAYLKSHERYNEIRRLCRPYVSVRREMARRNRRLLRQALRAGERALELLEEEKYALYRDNVLAWVEYLRAELDWLTPPAMACPPDGSLGPDEGFRAMVRDHCYRWGERCWEDFASFFVRADFFGPDRCDCRATATAEGLKVSLREHGIDWAQRRALWRRHRGSVNQTGFMQVMLDPDSTFQRVIHYTIYFQGSGGTVREFSERPDGTIVHRPPSILRGCRVHFQHTDSSWRLDLVIPWRQLGGRPAPGQRWRINVLSNPSVTRNRRMIWCQGYEYRDDVARLGWLVFV